MALLSNVKRGSLLSIALVICAFAISFGCTPPLQQPAVQTDPDNVQEIRKSLEEAINEE